MGVVFRARDLALHRTVALKMVAPLGDEVAQRCFRKEAGALAQVRHENVVELHAYGQHLGAAYFAMEHIEGEDLRTILEARARGGETLSLEQALTIIRGLARGLDAVHACGLVHRDVKPDNVIIEISTERPVLVDFGLARSETEPGADLSSIAGTPLYMAPEQVNGGTITARTDLYALACTAFELLAGRGVFDEADAFSIMLAHVHRSPGRISSIKPRLEPLDDVMLRALAKDPADRHESCTAFSEDLDRRATRINEAHGNALRPVRVLVLERDGVHLDHVVSVMAGTLERAGDCVAIECVASSAELSSAFAHEAADIVVIGEGEPNAGGLLVDRLRSMPGGPFAEFLVLAPESKPSLRLADRGARELPVPVNLNVLRRATAQMGLRVAERRSIPPPGQVAV
jgi:eukaryotic-like serine/threonine-protein kinase